MKTKKIDLSIVLPVYNVESYIERCLNSLFSSEISDLCVEYILVDDGSKDNSVNVCKKIKEKNKNKNIIIVQKENGGLGSTRNVGIDYSSGRYIFFIDPDDWIEKKFFSDISQVMKKYLPDIIKFGYKRVTDDKVIFEKFPFLESKYYSFQEKEMIYNSCLENKKLFDSGESFIMSACMAIYNLDIIKDNKIYFKNEKEILNEDILFNLEYLLNINSAFIFHETYYYYYCRSGSLTQSYREKMYERKIALFNYCENMLLLNNKLEKYEKSYSKFVIEHIYDCLVMEINRNKDKKDMVRRIKIILKDKRLKKALNKISIKEETYKAKIICILLKLRLHFFFIAFYKCVINIKKFLILNIF